MYPSHVSAYLIHTGSDNMSSSSQMAHFPRDTIARLRRGVFILSKSEQETDVTIRWETNCQQLQINVIYTAETVE